MNHSAKAYSVLICLISAPATPVLAGQPPDPTASDNMANTAVGTYALWNVQPDANGCHNTASGEVALFSDTTGSYNTATGVSALYSNVTGNNNTATGFNSLYYNTGNDNTASGYQALYTNSTGIDNVAAGSGALYSNTTGNANAAYGFDALYSNTSGGTNAAVGGNALFANTTGANNTAFGSQALSSNTTGKGNAAQGANALFTNTTGIRNLAIGSNALYSNNGSYNIALGFDAGYNVTTGSNNIEIGTTGRPADNNTIQIGMQGTQTSTTIAGIYGTTITGSAVYVTSSGQLGVLGSSERFKTDIASMPELSDKLQQLRPVTFTYKTDPKRVQQYGLIAEEVDKVYPELVIRDDKGKIQGVRYEELAPMLLNEMQKQQMVVAAQAAEIRDLKKLVVEMHAGLLQLQAKDQLVAQR